MNMGQCAMKLNNTYKVNADDSIALHVAQPPPNANLLQPGPLLQFVVVAGIPSNGTMALVGNGTIGTQPTAPAVPLPAPAPRALPRRVRDGQRDGHQRGKRLGDGDVHMTEGTGAAIAAIAIGMAVAVRGDGPGRGQPAGSVHALPVGGWCGCGFGCRGVVDGVRAAAQLWHILGLAEADAGRGDECCERGKSGAAAEQRRTAFMRMG